MVGEVDRDAEASQDTAAKIAGDAPGGECAGLLVAELGRKLIEIQPAEGKALEDSRLRCDVSTDPAAARRQGSASALNAEARGEGGEDGDCSTVAGVEAEQAFDALDLRFNVNVRLVVIERDP